MRMRRPRKGGEHHGVFADVLTRQLDESVVADLAVRLAQVGEVHAALI